MSDATNKIKARIMALLAKANGTDNANEAEIFLAKANEMLQQYQLDIRDLADENDPVTQHIGMSVSRTGHAWRWKLYVAVGALYGCKNVIHQIGKDLTITLVGNESGIMTADLMAPWITQQVREQAKRLAPITGMSEQGQAKRVAAALIGRIYRVIEQNKVTAPTTEAGRNALVLLDQVDAYYKHTFGDLDPIRTGKAMTDALSKAAAETIGLHRQTTGHSPLKIGSK